MRNRQKAVIGSDEILVNLGHILIPGPIANINIVSFEVVFEGIDTVRVQV